MRLRFLTLEDRVPGARDAVLVRAADHRRDLVEVEDRRGRGHLPLDRVRAPRVSRGRWAVTPRADHVVEEDEERGAEDERGDRDEQIPARVLLRVVRYA